ncbi:hypothetical protein MERGE_000494 [Pneumocystis wakefieldiae]|uniref:Uncharacterized protein n=1 Tax=Pneumocystis wakefieldiae TaxID=38082 RepID=A0A899G3T6_9ASCO|nr:hypothetical protein MERGE_000494 [Pneumocystis wakefieldiae]
MNIINKVILKLSKPKDKTLSKDCEISDSMHFGRKSSEINIKHAKYMRFIANKKNIFMLTLDTLININFPLKGTNPSNHLYKSM